MTVDDETMPDAAEAALLAAAVGKRLRRCYYTDSYVDAVVAGGMGGRGGKVDTGRLKLMVERGWLLELPEQSPNFDYMWAVTDAGVDALLRYRNRPGGWRR